VSCDILWRWTGIRSYNQICRLRSGDVCCYILRIWKRRRTETHWFESYRAKSELPSSKSYIWHTFRGTVVHFSDICHSRPFQIFLKWVTIHACSQYNLINYIDCMYVLSLRFLFVKFPVPYKELNAISSAASLIMRIFFYIICIQSCDQIIISVITLTDLLHYPSTAYTFQFFLHVSLMHSQSTHYNTSKEDISKCSGRHKISMIYRNQSGFQCIVVNNALKTHWKAATMHWKPDWFPACRCIPGSLRRHH